MLEFDLVRVTDVRYIRGYILWLRFSDGLTGEIDLANDLRGEVCEPLHDPQLFAQVYLDLEAGTIAWPNGADWAPDTLHERVRAAKGLPTKSNDDDPQDIARNLAVMPEISPFFGIVIRMFYVEHARPHFHAQFGETPTILRPNLLVSSSSGAKRQEDLLYRISTADPPARFACGG